MSIRATMRAAVWAASVASTAPRALAAPASTAPSPEITATTAPTGPLDINQSTQRLASILNARDSTREQRNEAAQQLAEIATPQAREVLSRGLSNGDERVQAACARAAAEAPSPDPAWVQPLIRLLGRTDAAARTLARFDTTPAAYEALIEFARSRAPVDVRAAAIRAAGQVIQKPVAEALVGLIGIAGQDPAIRSAAADALADLSGQDDIGLNPQQWTQWLNARASRPPAEWRTQVLAEQHPRLERDVERLRQLKATLEAMMLEQYQRDPKSLPGYLNNSDPQIRAIGASLVPRAIALGQPVGPDIHRRLIELVGDGSADVRLAAVGALRGLADPDALDAMLTELQLEREPEVKVALCEAVGNIGNARAVPILTRLLNDPSPRVAAQAAMALRNLAPGIRQNPAQTRQVLDVLTATFSTRTGPPGQPNGEPGSEDLRVALLSAMAPLADMGPGGEMFNLFADMANPNRNESPAVRRVALEALGTIGIRAANLIVQELDPASEPDPSVRIAALHALGQTGSFDYANQVDDHTLPQREPNADVRRHAQAVFQSLLPKATPQQLTDWAQRFKRRDDPSDEIVVLKTLCDKLAKQGPSPDLAINQQNLGDLYLRSVNQPANAIPYFRPALEFWQAQRVQQQNVYTLVKQMISALVRSKQYPEAIQFAQQQIRNDPASQQIVGSQFRNEAQLLIDAGKRGGPNSTDAFRDAARLINLILNMDPPVGGQYSDELKSMLEQQIPASALAP